MRLGPALAVVLTTSAAVAVAVAAGASADNDTGAKISVASAIGSVGLSATSTAPFVQFTVDGVALAKSPVTNGVAHVSVPTWGHPNGTHSAGANDCSDSGCTGPGSSDTFVVGNPAPTITSPVDGGSVLGGFTVRASSPGGALRLLVDGRSAGFADGPTYSFAHTASALPPGRHTLQVIECSTDHTWCSGSASPAAHITSRPLSVGVSASPRIISPNHDGVRDSTSLRVVLDRPETVVVSVLDSHGRTLKSYPARTFAKGVHYGRWTGLGLHHRTAPDGTYMLRVAVSARVGGARVTGSAGTTIRIDRHPPSVRAISGANTWFYPVRDGYRDTFTSTMGLSEPAQVRMTVRNSRHRFVRTLVASGTSRASVTWNGRDYNGRIVPAGRYTWKITVIDNAGNRATTVARFVTVSHRRLIKHTVALSARGNAFTGTQLSSSCATASTRSSVYRSSGVLLSTSCSPSALGPQVSAADYTFTLPAAQRYGTVSLRVTGSSVNGPSQIEASFPTSTNTDVTMAGMATVTSPSPRVYSLGSVPAASHLSGRQVHLVLSVDDLHVDSSPNRVSSFDVAALQLTATYYLLT